MAVNKKETFKGPQDSRILSLSVIHVQVPEYIFFQCFVTCLVLLWTSSPSWHNIRFKLILPRLLSTSLTRQPFGNLTDLYSATYLFGNTVADEFPPLWEQ